MTNFQIAFAGAWALGMLTANNLNPSPAADIIREAATQAWLKLTEDERNQIQEISKNYEY